MISGNVRVGEKDWRNANIITRKMPKGNAKPSLSGRWKVYPTRQHFIGDHPDVISESNEMGALKGQAGRVGAAYVVDEEADKVRTVELSEAEFHLSFGRNVEVAHSTSFRVSRGDRTIAPGGSATTLVVNSRCRAVGGN